MQRTLRRLLRSRSGDVSARRTDTDRSEGGGGEVEPRRAAEALVDAGDLTGAVDLLVRANRTSRDPELEVRLVQLRRAAAKARPTGNGREPWPPPYVDPFPEAAGTLPEIGRHDVTTDLVGGAVAHHGAIIVRGLFSPAQVSRCVAAIDRAHEVREGVDAGRIEPDADYAPIVGDSPTKTKALRAIVAEQGGIWLADSPSATVTTLDALDEVGAVTMMTEHFGDRPYFSLQKSTLRRSPAERKIVAWHQDGSFLHPDVRTMNVWVALTACGGDLPTPGLEVVPRRMGEILPVDGILSPHSIGEDLVAAIASETPTITPRFAAGDALVFDQHLLHRTHHPLVMTHPRYALECWFFAPSHQTPNYVPLLV